MMFLRFLVTSSVRCWPDALSLASAFSLPSSRWIDRVMFAFHPLAQKSRSLCLEYLSEALSNCPFAPLKVNGRISNSRLGESIKINFLALLFCAILLTCYFEIRPLTLRGANI